MSIPEQIRGLSSTEVAERIRRGEQNRHSIRSTRTYWQIIRANIFSLFNSILLGTVAILLILRGFNDTLIPAAFVAVNIVLGLVQEVRAKRALDKLAALSGPTVSVLRDGRSVIISIENIVQNDVVELRPGNSIVIDGPILASDSLEIDESLLTGESEYVPKQVGDKLLSGSFCVAGAGLMQAENIGNKSYVNNLARTARAYKNTRTSLEQNLDAILKVLIATMLVLAPLTVIAGIVRDRPLGESLENAVNLIGNLVPQGLIILVTFSFAYGALNISRFKALIQRLNAIESIGHVTCLCADKTGTLTRNILSVKVIIPASEVDLQIVQDKLAVYVEVVSWQNRTVAAIGSYINGVHINGAHQPPSKVAEVPFNSERRWSAVTLSSGETLILGAPEILLANSNLEAKALNLSEQGLRVVAFATSQLMSESTGTTLPSMWRCLALIGLQDEIRSDISETLVEFAKQGITIKIISGDSPETVKAIAHQAGILEKSLLTGPEVEQLDDDALITAAQRTTLFARITPEIKRRIVASLAKQDTVAMIGDGVNDVPALKEASVAIAMNDGAQIAKDVSDIILLNNAFSTLPWAVAEGREITQRIYVIAKISLVKVVNLTILAIMSGFVGLPWPVTLLQTSFIGIIIITIPSILIIFKWLPTTNSKDAPQDILKYVLLWGIISGLAMTFISIFALVVLREDLMLSRTMITAFDCLCGSLILWDVYQVNPFSPMSFVKNIRPALAGVILGAFSAIILEYLMPTTMGFVPLGWLNWILLAVILSVSFVVLQYSVHKSPFGIHDNRA